MSLIEMKSEAAGSAAFDATTAKVYNPVTKFQVGEAVFHSEWNDVGKVLNKTRTSDGSESITVMFEKQGERRLISNLKSELLEIL